MILFYLRGELKGIFYLLIKEIIDFRICGRVNRIRRSEVIVGGIEMLRRLEGKIFFLLIKYFILLLYCK